MHLLVAAHDFYPDPGSGGTGRYVHETTRRLAERGHDVSVLTRRRGDVPLRETVAGVRVARYDLSVAGESAPHVAAQLSSAALTVRVHRSSLANCLGGASPTAPSAVASFSYSRKLSP